MALLPKRVYGYVIEPGADLNNANLSDANLMGANLSGANLTNANLSGANLLRAKLQGAKLTGADLTGVNLTLANLAGGSLSGAKLSDAKLSISFLKDINLTGANLINASLNGANLSGANLTGADLSGANLTDVNLTDVNLTDAGLLGADHHHAKFMNTTMPDGSLRTNMHNEQVDERATAVPLIPPEAESSEWSAESKAQLVLDLWMSTYGLDNKLTQKRQQDFLNHPSIEAIIKYPIQQVQWCIKKHQKLDKILHCLEEITLEETSPKKKSRESRVRYKPFITGREEGWKGSNFDINTRPDYI